MEALPTNRMEILEMLPRDSVGCEVGTFRGNFALRMLRIVKPRLLYLVDYWDIPPYADPGWWRNYNYKNLHAMARTLSVMAHPIYTGRVRVLCALSTEAAQMIPDDTLDWVYIDADHTYSGCLGDLEAYYPKVKSGGVIAGHDYVEPSKWIGVPQAVREFSENHRIQPLHLTEDINHSFWFVKPEEVPGANAQPDSNCARGE